MNKDTWIETITGALMIAPDYIPAFQITIGICAEILEERDKVHDEYIKTGARPVIEFTSDRGAVNLKPNPLLKQWQELNTTALSYLRDLGITPAGLRKLQGQIPKEEEKKKGFSKLDSNDDTKKQAKAEGDSIKEKAAAKGMTEAEYLSWYQKEYNKSGCNIVPDDSIFMS